MLESNTEEEEEEEGGTPKRLAMSATSSGRAEGVRPDREVPPDSGPTKKNLCIFARSCAGFGFGVQGLDFLVEG